MTPAKPFSKLKKQIESLFIPELKMRVNCISYPIRSQYGSSSIPRFYVQLGKEIIWDFPKDFPIKDIHYHYWKEDTGISNLIREYIDTPILALFNKKFKGERIIIESQKCNFYLGLIDMFIAADRRIGKDKLMQWSSEIENPKVKLILAKRFDYPLK